MKLLLGPHVSTTSTDVFPSAASQKWLAQFAGPGGDEGFYRPLLVELPALHNFVDLMVETDMQPSRKDSNNHFMDNEILVAPFAYADVFVSKDKGIRNLLRNTNRHLLARTKCQYCDNLTELEKWLAANVA